MLGPTEDPAGITAPMAVDILTRLGGGVEEQKSPAPSAPRRRISTPRAQFWRNFVCRRAPCRRALLGSRCPAGARSRTRDSTLIEEIARVYGYNRFRNTLPGSREASSSCCGPRRNVPCAARCSPLGWNEAISCELLSADDAAHSWREPGASSRSVIRSAKKPACCAPSLVTQHARHARAHTQPRRRRRRAVRDGHCLQRRAGTLSTSVLRLDLERRAPPSARNLADFYA